MNTFIKVCVFQKFVVYCYQESNEHVHYTRTKVDVFAGDEPLAKSVNHLLVVGFYLIILGFVSLALKTTAPVTDTRQAIEVLAGKMGLVLLVLGGMHFLNLIIFARIRHTALASRRSQPMGEAPGPGYTPFQ